MRYSFISKSFNLPVLAAIMALSQGARVHAGTEVSTNTETSSLSAPSDLTLGNFFSEGWNQPYVHRADPNAAPDMALLRVQTNFLEREVRFDFASTRGIHNPTKQNTEFFDGLVAYSFNRRFMLEVVSNTEWDDFRGGNNLNGWSGAVVGRLQLIDLPGSSYAITVRAQTPNTGIDVNQTTLSAALAGWQDLTPIGLYRTGLYFHVQEESYVGPGDAGIKRNDMTYDISLARTWTRPDMPVLGNFTTFVEGYGVTNLDGDDRGLTTITITPGIRTTLFHNNVLMAGVDIPVTSPRAESAIYRVTYIVNF